MKKWESATLFSCIFGSEARPSALFYLRRKETVIGWHPGRDAWAHCLTRGVSQEQNLQEWPLPGLAGRGPGKVAKKGIFFFLRAGLAHGFHTNSLFQPKPLKNCKHQVTPGIQTLPGPDWRLSWPMNKAACLTHWDLCTPVLQRSNLQSLISITPWTSF